MICAQLHKVAYILAHKGHIPHIKDIIKMKTDEHIFSEVEKNMKQRQTNFKTATKVTVDLMEDHLVNPARK
jgi:hypothetical protein